MKKLSLLLALVLCISLNQSYAQFEGEIKFTVYEMESGEKMKNDDAFSLFITPDRMMLRSSESLEVTGSIETEGLLVRHKEKDFVLLSSDEKAMQITKSDITSLMNMFGGNATDQMKEEVEEAEPGLKMEKTNEMQSINGYEAQKFIFTNEESPNERSEVWMTKGLNINWGILAEPWGDNVKQFAGADDFPIDMIFEDDYFPVKMQQFKDGELTEEVVAEINTKDVEAMVQIPSGMQVVNLQAYLFQQMRNSQ
jgi:hypothetical protein